MIDDRLDLITGAFDSAIDFTYLPTFFIYLNLAMIEVGDGVLENLVRLGGSGVGEWNSDAATPPAL